MFLNLFFFLTKSLETQGQFAGEVQSFLPAYILPVIYCYCYTHLIAPDVLYSTQTQTRRLATINITCFICIVQFLSHKGLSSCCLTEDWGKNQKEKAKRNIRKLRRHDYCIFLWTSRVCLGVGLIQINARTIIFKLLNLTQIFYLYLKD